MIISTLQIRKQIQKSKMVFPWLVHGRTQLGMLKDKLRYIFLLEYNCFTILYQFLLYNEVHQLYVYIYALPLVLPSCTLLLRQPPIPPSWVITEHQTELPVLYGRFPLAIYFTHGSVYMSIPISQFIPFPLPPSPVSTHPFSTSPSLFLPCKQVHLYHFLDSTYMC